VIHDLLGVVAKMNAQILQAVFVLGGIEDLVYADTAGLLLASANTALAAGGRIVLLAGLLIVSIDHWEILLIGLGKRKGDSVLSIPFYEKVGGFALYKSRKKVYNNLKNYVWEVRTLG